MRFKQLANGITSANLLCGLSAVLVAVNGHLSLAAWIIIAAIGLDMIDGKVARRFKMTSSLGKELDSLSDLISFGVAPAVFIYMINDTSLGLSLIPLSMYLLCVAYRLARFNVSAGPGADKFFEGLPSPAAGGTIASSFLFLQRAGVSFKPYIFLILAMILAFLMVSKIKYPTLKEEKLFRLKYVAGFLALAILICLIFGPAVMVCLIFLTYDIFGPLKSKWEVKR